MSFNNVFKILDISFQTAKLDASINNGMMSMKKTVAHSRSGDVDDVKITQKDGGHHFSIEDDTADQIKITFHCQSDEGFMGFGEQFSNLNMAGKSFTLCTSEQGIGRGKQPLSALVNLASKGAAGNEFTTYAPQPVFITTKGRAVCFEQQSIYWFDFSRSAKGVAEVTVWGNRLSGYIFEGTTPLELIEKHTAVTGRLRALPKFAYDTILGLRGGMKHVDKILSKCLEHGTKVSALWIEDWQGKRGKNGGPPLWWRWYPDESVYPNFKKWASQLKSEGIALLGYANPFLSLDDNNPLYIEGREKNYFIKNNDGSDYVQHFFSGKEYTYVCVDLTNPSAYDWLKAKMKSGMVESGLSGWMADYGEYTPPNKLVFSGDAVTAHCEMPVLWAKLNSELIDECGLRGELLTFHRSSGTFGSKFATAYWAGDQNPTLDKHDGLASSITALITSGISGMSINHTDIGGFTTLITPIYKMTRKKEVMLRWIEYAAFTPIYRTHDGAYENPLNYQFYYDDDGYEAFAKFSKVHSALKWYLLKLENLAVNKGLPMVRGLYLHYPTDLEGIKIDHQYLLGEDILVNPVYRLGDSSVKCYLPHDEWVSPYQPDKVIVGGRYVELPAPLGRPAVLIRSNSEDYEQLIRSLETLLD